MCYVFFDFSVSLSTPVLLVLKMLRFKHDLWIQLEDVFYMKMVCKMSGC